MATLNARLDKLEALANPKAPQLLLFLVRQAGTESDDESIVGLRGDGVPALQRQHGESLDELTDRAKAMCTTGGVVILFADYADMGTHARGHIGSTQS